MLVSKKEIEVRYAETDQMGVVYHANYLVWMEIGRTQFISDLGFSYAQMERDGVLSPVIDIQASYKSRFIMARQLWYILGLRTMTVYALCTDTKFLIQMKNLR